LKLCRIKVRVLTAILLVAAPGFSPIPNSAGSPGNDLTLLERQVFQYVNQERRAHQIPELTWSAPLALEARKHAVRLAQQRLLSHEDPLRGHIDKRLEQAGVPWRRCAENLYESNYPDPAKDAVQAWLRSSGHRRNLMDAELSDTGVGASRRSDGGIIIVQEYVLR